jgi:hypothetical protein
MYGVFFRVINGFILTTGTPDTFEFKEENRNELGGKVIKSASHR